MPKHNNLFSIEADTAPGQRRCLRLAKGQSEELNVVSGLLRSVGQLLCADADGRDWLLPIRERFFPNKRRCSISRFTVRIETWLS
jgi:hypothetical protein